MSDEHIPVLCEETIKLVTEGHDERTEGGATFVDATFGRGGHSRALLSAIGSRSRLIALDRDAAAVAAARELGSTDSRVSFCQARFSELADVLERLAAGPVAGVIMDLGVSSPQLDDPGRGFSFRGDGPLDMRMDQSSGESAADWLNQADEKEIARVIRTYGEERHAGRIAAAIVAARPLATTRELADVVRRVMPSRRASQRSRSDDATRTFQAIRIQVNEELTEITAGIDAAFGCLRISGRLAVISFHSLEDRLVKQSFRRLARGRELPRGLPVRADEMAAPAKIVAGPIRAGAAELARNPRARSATLRVLERLA